MVEQRYRVIERLESGGMAEVFRGEASSVQGFRKRVAIKRVLPHLAKNEKFMSMFLDEARLGARLNHANVVSVLDIGSADNTYFIVMEYVNGTNLKRLSETVRKKGQQIGLKEALLICVEACRGLSYAHELHDEHDVPLNIVHRDISPPNIMLSRRGETKLTDFGLAKAATQLEKTDPGVVKGKFSYLSPEAANGLEVDARADLFALGIVLWELLSGRRLFLGSTDYQTVKLIQKAEVPVLKHLHPDVDDDFQVLLGRALARDRNARFQTAREMGDALAGYLFDHRMKVTSYDIANLVKEVVSSPVVSGRKEQGSPIDRLIQEELLRFTSLDDAEGNGSLGSQPLSAHDIDGGSYVGLEKGPGAKSLENPGIWFQDDDEVTQALDSYIRTASTTTGWSESGRDEYFASDSAGTAGNLANLLEAEHSEVHSARSEEIDALLDEAEVELLPSSHAAPPPASKWPKVLVFAVLLVAAIGITGWLLRGTFSF